MTPEQQRIAIAEWCGWKHSWRDRRRDNEYQHTSDLPDYLNDLNAMHEAVSKLNKLQRVDFQLELEQICRSSVGLSNWARMEPHERFFEMVNSTAAQRAEALLRTIGKWR